MHHSVYWLGLAVVVVPMAVLLAAYAVAMWWGTLPDDDVTSGEGR